MPTYEYACDACGKEWEIEQRISEDPIKKCPKCGKLKAQRMITQGNFILKGGGWYADAYSSAKPSASKTSSNSVSESKDSKNASSSDSAAATTSASSSTADSGATAPTKKSKTKASAE